MAHRTLFAAFLLLATSALPSRTWAQNNSVILATTTSTQDSGLLDVLLPVFEKQTGLFVKPIAVGSGQAMAMGAKGEADVLLVHSPEAEQAFMATGKGLDRRLVMHNDFVIVGPTQDPAKTRAAKTAGEALSKIAAAGSLFISRGDNSGTHAREKGLWKASKVTPEGKTWYHQTGLGMGQTLQVASEKQGYTLVDRGTWLAHKRNLALQILVEGEARLLNVYHVIRVNPAHFPKVNAQGSKALAQFFLSPETQKRIGEFGKQKLGTSLFMPDAGKKEAELAK